MQWEFPCQNYLTNSFIKGILYYLVSVEWNGVMAHALEKYTLLYDTVLSLHIHLAISEWLSRNTSEVTI
jgi:hypothetical protein